MKELIVKEEKELLVFLKENVSGSKNHIKSLLTNELVSVNGKTTTKYNYLLKVNDKVSIGAKKVNSFLGNIKIIYEDKDYLIVDKPSGMLTIATEDDKDSNNNLYHVLSNYVKKKNSNSKIFIVHRLDKDTSGVILFAKNEKLKELLQDKWNDIAKRTYYAVVYGKTKEKEVLKSYLKEDKNLMTYVSEDGKLAITEYERINFNDNYSLLKIIINDYKQIGKTDYILEINIKTGRRNQIRVQLKSINHPIVGDYKYGHKDKSVKRMMLHAETLELVNPVNKKIMVFKSNLDSYFYRLVEK